MKKTDDVTVMLKKLTRTVEDSIDKGFDRVISNMNGGTRESISAANKKAEEAAKTQQKKDAADRARDLRASVERKMYMQAQTRGWNSFQQKAYITLSNSTDRISKITENTSNSLKRAIKEFKGMIEDNLTGILKTFTGPFYGLIKNTGNVLFRGLSRIFVGPIALTQQVFKQIGDKTGAFFSKFSPTNLMLKLTDKLGKKIIGDTFKVPVPWKDKGSDKEGGEPKATSLDDIRIQLDYILKAQGIAARAIIDTIYEVGGWFKQGNILAAGNNARDYSDTANPKKGLVAVSNQDQFDSPRLNSFSVGLIKYADFMHETMINLDDNIEKITKMIERGDVGGGGGLLDTMGDLGNAKNLLGKGGLKKLLFGKMSPKLAIGGGVVAGALGAWHGYKDGRESGMSKKESGANAVARGMISGSFATIGGLLGGTVGMTIGGIIGDKVGKLSNNLGEYLGDKAFDMTSSLSKKIPDIKGAVETKLSGMTASVKGVFSKTGNQFKDLQKGIRDRVDGFLPAGSNITDVLKNILNSLMQAGAKAKEIVVQTGRQARDYIQNTDAYKAASISMKKVSGAVKGLVMGGSNWKADMKGVNGELTKRVQNMAKEYKATTGKDLVVTEGMRTAAQQQYLREHGKYTTAKGRSLHQDGLAIDIDKDQANELDNMGLLKKYGLARPVANDPVHLEMAEYTGRAGHAALRKKLAQEEQAKQQVAARGNAKPVQPQQVAARGNAKPKQAQQQVAANVGKPKLPMAAKGALVKTEGAVHLHPGEIVSPIGKFTDMLARTATNVAQPIATSAIQSSGGMANGEITKYLATVVQCLQKIATMSGSDGKSQKAVPDGPGDPSVLYAGNFYNQKGKQWG